jgi:acetyltransferase-like isoleucine patch superfamily enzyme
MSNQNKIRKNELLSIRLDIIGLISLLLILGISLVIPISCFIWLNDLFHPVQPYQKILVLSFSLPIAYILFGFSLLTLTLVLKQIFGLKSKEGVVPLNSKSLYPFIIYHSLFHIASFFFIALIRGSNVFKKYCQLFGLKIGKSSTLQSIRISDFDLISIGNNSVIGFDAVLCAHSVEGNYLFRKRVRIGNNVVIGHYSILSPGVIIEDNVVLGANSFVPKNTILKAGRIYGGVPAKEIGNTQIPLKKEETETPEGKSEQLNNTQIDALLKIYELNRNELLSIETTINNVYISTLGLLVTIFGFIVVNEKVKLISMIPIVIEFAYAYIINSSISMLKLGKSLYKVEIILKSNGIKHFDWESKEGILGNSRGFDLDSILLNVIFLIIFLSSFAWTVFGNIFTSTDIFLSAKILKIILILNSLLIAWIIFSGLYFARKRKNILIELKNNEYSGFE